jgi:hypothetical protein
VEDKQMDASMLHCIQNAITGLLSPVPLDADSNLFDSPDTMEASPSMDATPTYMETTPTSSVARDYDPDKFSDFADFLVKMDPTETLSSLPEGDFMMAALKTNEADSFKSTMYEPTTKTQGHTPLSMGHNSSSVGHTPSSIDHTPLGTADASDSQITVTTIAHGSSGDNIQTTLVVPNISSPLGTTDAMRIPEVPMSWFSSGNEAISLKGGVSQNLGDSQNHIISSGETSMSTLMDIPGIDFPLDVDSDNWQQFLDSSFDSPTPDLDPTFSDTGFSHFVDNLTAPGSSQVPGSHFPADAQPSNSEAGGSGSQSIPHNMDTAAGGSDSWNGMWHDSNPGSITNWLQSTFPPGKDAKGCV